LIDLVREGETEITVWDLPFPSSEYASYFRTDREVGDVVSAAKWSAPVSVLATVRS
jgi:hypothetical protein